jgi:hypothetical protein
MKPPRPSARITLGGRELSAAEAGVFALRVTLERTAHDAAELALWPRSKFASASPGDALELQLGFEDEEEAVWAGSVTGVELSERALSIGGHAPTAALSRERKAQTYVGQTVADVVRDLASSVDIDAVEGDAELAYYAVDHRRSVWGHLLDLAALTGSELSASPSGGLRFVKPSNAPSATRFRYGAEVLAWRAGPTAEGDASVYASHGSASESGAEKWHWLNRSSGGAGVQVIAAFHSKALAESLSTTVAERVKRATLAGDVELLGQATLRPGDTFTLADMPGGDIGPVRALRIVHTLDAVRGFRTLVRVQAA